MFRQAPSSKSRRADGCSVNAATSPSPWSDGRPAGTPQVDTNWKRLSSSSSSRRRWARPGRPASPRRESLTPCHTSQISTVKNRRPAEMRRRCLLRDSYQMFYHAYRYQFRAPKRTAHKKLVSRQSATVSWRRQSTDCLSTPWDEQESGRRITEQLYDDATGIIHHSPLTSSATINSVISKDHACIDNCPCYPRRRKLNIPNRQTDGQTDGRTRCLLHVELTSMTYSTIDHMSTAVANTCFYLGLLSLSPLIQQSLHVHHAMSINAPVLF